MAKDKEKKKSWWFTSNRKFAKWAWGFIIIVLLLAAIGACSGGSSDEDTTVSEITEEKTEDNGTVIPINESTTFGDGLYKISLDNVDYLEENHITFTFTVTNDSEEPHKITDILGWDGYQEFAKPEGGYDTFTINMQTDNTYHRSNLKLLDETVDPHSSKTVTLESTLKDDSAPVYIEFYSDGSSGLSSPGDEYVTVEINLKDGTFTTDRMDFY